MSADLPQSSASRIHLLDDTWLLTIFAMLIAIGLPWVLSGFEVSFIAASLGLLALGGLHMAISLLARRPSADTRRAPLILLHATGIVIVAFVWMSAGGVQNPAFLSMFALPVIGASFLSRWQPYLMALLAIVLAAIVALTQVPELRWYVPSLGAMAAWMASAWGGSVAPIRGFYAPSSYYVVLLQVFAIALLAIAIAADYLGTIVERLRSNLDAVRAEAEDARLSWSALLADLPLPTVMVDPDTLRILLASDQVRTLCRTADSEDRPLFDAIEFTYPDVVQQLITGEGGSVPLAMIRCGDRLLATEVRVQHTVQSGRRLALIAIQDRTPELTLRAALDVIGQAALVVDPRGRIVAFNQPSRALFARLEPDIEAAAVLAREDMPERWWDAGLMGRRKLHVHIAPRIYQVTTTAVPLPGEDAQLQIVTFLPIAPAGDRPPGDEGAPTRSSHAASRT